jgi:hypothetical protein
MQINLITSFVPRCLSGLACSTLKGLDRCAPPPPPPAFSHAGRLIPYPAAESPPGLQRALWVTRAGLLWPAGGPGGRLYGGALSSISAIDGGGARGKTGVRGRGGRGAALRSRVEEAARTSGAGEPGSHARQSAAISGKVRAPGGARAFPRGAGAGLNLRLPQRRGLQALGQRAGVGAEGWLLKCMSQGCKADGGTERRKAEGWRREWGHGQNSPGYK